MRFFVALLASALLATTSGKPPGVPEDIPQWVADPKSGSALIVGGTRASLGEFPYQIYLETNKNGGGYMCGGSIIGSRWVLTAAHCVVDNKNRVVPASANTIYAGAVSLSPMDRSGYARKVVKVVVHPTYLDNQKVDLALLQIEGTFLNNANSKTIKMAEPGSTASGNAVATGWGNTSEDGESSNVLLKVTLPIVANSRCERYRGWDAKFQLCAGGLPQGGKDTCQGDSGGPLAQNGVLVGVVSGGEGCARPNIAAIYVRVSALRDWIKKESGI